MGIGAVRDAGVHGRPAVTPARRQLPWPLPALLAWGAGWATYLGLLGLGATAVPAWLAGVLLPLALRPAGLGRLRTTLLLGGFPLSTLALGAGGVPAWAWLAALAALLALYPVQAWRDAPFFPTARDALQGLAEHIELPDGARVIDAGCGLGHGLVALRHAWPQVRAEGHEHSALLALGTALRCRWARVRRGDMWKQSWAEADLVYLFQRPESMARAWQKAQAEMAPGAWLVSLEFDVPGVPPDHVVQRDGARTVRAWRLPDPAYPAQPSGSPADIRGRAARRRAARSSRPPHTPCSS